MRAVVYPECSLAACHNIGDVAIFFRLYHCNIGIFSKKKEEKNNCQNFGLKLVFYRYSKS